MRDLVAVFRREVAERRMALLLAAAAGLVPLALPLLPAFQRHSASEVRGGAAVVFALVAGVTAAIAWGGSIWANDAATGRLSFYLSRPIRSSSLWAGKLAALCALLAAVVALTALPGLIAGERAAASGLIPLPDGRSAPEALWLAGGLLALALVSHLLRTLATRRSALIFVDLAVLLGAAAVLTACARRLLDAPALPDLWRGASGLLTLVAGISLVAVALEISRGRADAARGRRLASVAFWAGLSLAAAAGWAFTRWTLAVEIADLEWATVSSVSSNGRWAFIGGRARHRADYFQTFLVDLESGDARPLGGSIGVGSGYFFDRVDVSADGSRAAWRHFGYRSRSVSILDLSEDKPPVELGDASVNAEIALSPSGRYYASYGERRLQVVDLAAPGQRLVAVEDLPRGASPAWLRFLGEERLRVFARDVSSAATLAVWDMDLSNGKLESVCVSSQVQAVSLSKDATRVVVVRTRSTDGPVERRALFGIPECATLATLDDSRLDWSNDLAFLADGRLAVVLGKNRTRILRLHERDGALQFHFDLGVPSMPRFGGMPSANQLVYTTAGGDRRDTYLLDLSTGARRDLGDDLQPIADPSTAIGSPATLLFATSEGLVRIDLATGARTSVTTVPAPRP